MAPLYCGTLFAMTNSLANTAGFLVPLVTGFITNQDSSRETWSYVWIIFVGVSAFGGLVYILLADCNQQSWAGLQPNRLSEVSATSQADQNPHSLNPRGGHETPSENPSDSDEEPLHPGSDEELLPAPAPIPEESLQQQSRSKSSGPAQNEANSGIVRNDRNNSEGSFLDVHFAVEFNSVNS